MLKPAKLQAALHEIAIDIDELECSALVDGLRLRQCCLDSDALEEMLERWEERGDANGRVGDGGVGGGKKRKLQLQY